MPFARFLRKLALIVWRDGGLSWLWLVICVLPTLIDIGTAVIPQRTKAAASMLENVSWWWGLVFLAVWVIAALSYRIFEYESETLDVIPEERQSHWIVFIQNTGRSLLKQCTLNIEDIQNQTGRSLVDQQYTLQRLEGKSGAFPLRGGQRKVFKFALAHGSKIRLFLRDSTGDQTIEFPEEVTIRIGAFSESVVKPAIKTLRLKAQTGRLTVEPFA